MLRVYDGMKPAFYVAINVSQSKQLNKLSYGPWKTPPAAHRLFHVSGLFYINITVLQTAQETHTQPDSPGRSIVQGNKVLGG